jgi:hypothetical protein
MTTQVPAFHDLDELPPNTALLGGRVVIDVRVGGGGAATVYAATTADGHDVAIKIMSTAHAELPTSRQRFRNEVMLAQQLAGHPGVVVPYEMGELPELGGRLYIAMPLVKGAPLLLEAGRLGVVEAVTVLRDLARILADVHRCGIVHRDVKPSNVLVRELDGTLVPYLIDFGLATSTGEGAAPSTVGLTAAHELPGTKHYMAPEQLVGARLDPRFDVYALGVTMMEVLTGVLPLHELSAAEAARRKCDASLPSLSIAGRVTGLPVELERVIDATLEREPEKRTASAGVVAEQLDAVLEVLRRRPRPRVVAAAEPEVPEVAEVPATERTLTQAIPPIAVVAGLHEYRARERERAEAATPAKVASPSSVELPVVRAPAPVPEPQRTRRAGAWIVGAVVLLAASVGAALVVGDGDGSHADRAVGQEAIPASATGVAASGAGLHEVDAVDEPMPADVGTSAGEHAAGDDSETNGVCPTCPTVEEQPEPTPPRKRDTPRKAPKPRPPKPTPEVDDPPCTDVDADTKAASRDKQWSRVLKLTQSPRCWDNDTSRRRARAKALMESGRLADCVKFGAADADADVRRVAALCTIQLEEAGTR